MTSILVGLLYRKKLIIRRITKKATVIIATFVPYLPFLPTKKMAMALGDRIRDKNTKTAPVNNTHNAM